MAPNLKRSQLLAPRQPSGQQGQIRIIGGAWRGRRFSVEDVEGLRPTPNRIRETLFNWLQNDIPGARCLDVFSGSGALGFEALSRGASQVTMLEQQQACYQQLQANKKLLNAEQAEIIACNALSWLQNNTREFDLIFLDPPFHQDLVSQCLPIIQQQHLLAERGRMYIETESGLALPENLIVDKQKRAGQVQYGLYRFQESLIGTKQ